jgi:hypothetical protein
MTLRLNDDGYLILGKGVNLKPYKPRPFIKREYMSEVEIRENAGSDLIIDAESYPNYFMIGFKHVQSGKYIVFEKNFDPRILCWIVMSYRTIGFNSLPYDLPMVWASYFNRDPQFLKDVSNALINRGMRPSEVEKEFNFECYKLQPRQHIDLFNVCPLRQSLKMYAARIHCKRIQDLPFPDYQPLEDWQVDVVRDYNGNDLDNTELLFKFVKERLQLREAISIEYDLDLMSKSDAQMAEAVISKEVSKLNGKWIKRITPEPGTVFKYKCPQYLMFATKPMQDLLARVKRAQFVLGDDMKIISPLELKEPVKIGNNFYTVGIGGLHSQDKCKAFEAKDGKKLKDVDVTSYYPRAIINLGLYPPSMGPNFLVVYDGFRIRRVDAKKHKRFTEDKGLKIFLNGVSGKWSDAFSNLYAPGNTIQMNITCQLTILMLAEMFECNGIEVVSANTDGVVIYYKEEDEEKVKYWWHYWEKLTNFQLEDNDYVKYYARDVNAYFAVKKNSEVKVKGPYSEVGSQSGTQLDTNPIMLICSDAIKELLSKGKPIEETIKNCRDITRFVVVRNVKGGAHKNGDYLGKVVRWVYFKNVIGTIDYVISGNKVPKSEGAEPMQDLPDEFPIDKIDHDRYIAETKEILMDIGYLSQPKQVEFFA